MVGKWGERWWSAQVVADLGDDVWKVHYEGWSESWDEAVGPDRIRAHPNGAVQPTVQQPTRRGLSRGCGFTIAIASLVVAAIIAIVVFSLATAPQGKPTATGVPVDSTTVIEVGQTVEIEWNGSWFNGSVLAVNSDGTFRVHYDGWADSYDEDVAGSRLRIPAGGSETVAPRGKEANTQTKLRVGQPVQVDWNGSWYAATILALRPDGSVHVHYEGWADSYDEDVPRSRLRAPAVP